MKNINKNVNINYTPKQWKLSKCLEGDGNKLVVLFEILTAGVLSDIIKGVRWGAIAGITAISFSTIFEWWFDLHLVDLIRIMFQ